MQYIICVIHVHETNFTHFIFFFDEHCLKTPKTQDYGTHCVSKIFYFDRESPRKSRDFAYQKMEKPYDTWVWDRSLW
jgi:hypothetical protein